MKDKQNSLLLLADKVVLAQDQEAENEIFLTVDVVVCDSNLNGNNEGVSKEFIADVVANNDRYLALPLYADTKRLLDRDYDNLTHMYSRLTRKFKTTQIGGFFNFRVFTEDGIDYLQATARIPKRESEICDRITELYEMGALCFSFEVKYRQEDTHVVNGGGRVIDVGEHNALTGVAVVSRPACENSVALDLVAELADGEEAEANRGELSKMDKEKELELEQVAISEEEEEAKEAIAEGEGAESGAETAGAEEAELEGDGDSLDEEPGDSKPEPVAKEPAADKGEEEVVPGAGDDDGEQKIVPVQETMAENAEVDEAEANAEVIMHEVKTEVRYDAGCPEYNIPPTIATETKEVIVETIDDQGGETAQAEEDPKDAMIAELKTRIAELEEIEAKYNKIMEAEAEKAIAEKRARAKAFAEKNGLDVQAEEVAAAIAELDYEKIANLSMDQKTAVAEKEEKQVPSYFQMATFVDMKTSGGYGSMLERRTR